MLLKKIVGILARSLVGVATISLLIIIIAHLPVAISLEKKNIGLKSVSVNFITPSEFDYEIRNGIWKIHQDSAVYATLRTPREKVNVKFTSVSGSAEVADMKAGKMKANVRLDITSLDSGLKFRDRKMLEPDFLDSVNHPFAVFELKDISRWPKKWREGDSQKFSASGSLTIKGITKEVNFECEGMFDGNRFNMEGTHTLDMTEYGIKVPDGILIRTEKEAAITLQLVFIQEGKEGSSH